MVKRKAILPTVLLVVAMAVSSVAAASGSPTANDPDVQSATVAGQDVTSDTLLTVYGETGAPAEVTAMLDSAHNELVAAGNKVTGLNGISESAVQAAVGSDVNVADLSLVQLVDISVIDAGGNVVAQNGAVELKILLPGINDGDVVVVAHNTATNTWQLVTATYANGVLTLSGFDTMSPFAIFKAAKGDAVATATPTPTTAVAASNTTTSAQTGEYASIYVMILAAALATAGVVFVTRARKATK